MKPTVKITLSSNSSKFQTYEFDTEQQALDFYREKTRQCGKFWHVTKVTAAECNRITVKNLEELDVYIANDQPATCPKCGARTEFIELADDKQQHQCPSCNYEFFLDFESEG